MSDKKGSSSTQGSGSSGKKVYESLLPAKKKLVSTRMLEKGAGCVADYCCINKKNNKDQTEKIMMMTMNNDGH